MYNVSVPSRRLSILIFAILTFIGSKLVFVSVPSRGLSILIYYPTMCNDKQYISFRPLSGIIYFNDELEIEYNLEDVSVPSRGLSILIVLTGE